MTTNKIQNYVKIKQNNGKIKYKCRFITCHTPNTNRIPTFDNREQYARGKPDISQPIVLVQCRAELKQVEAMAVVGSPHLTLQSGCFRWKVLNVPSFSICAFEWTTLSVS